MVHASSQGCIAFPTDSGPSMGQFIKKITEQWKIGLEAYARVTSSLPLQQASVEQVAGISGGGVSIITPTLTLKSVIDWCTREDIKIDDRFGCKKSVLTTVPEGKVYLSREIIQPQCGSFSYTWEPPFGCDFETQTQFGRHRFGVAKVTPTIVGLFLCSMRKYVSVAIPQFPESPIIRCSDVCNKLGRVALLIVTRERKKHFPNKIMLTILPDHHDPLDRDGDVKERMSRCVAIPFQVQGGNGQIN